MEVYYPKYPDGELPTENDLKNALSAFRSRITRESRDKWDLFKQRSEEALAGMLDEGMSKSQIRRCRRIAEMAVINADVQFKPKSLSSCTPLELPLWGYKAPHHASAKTLKGVQKKLATATPEEKEEIIKSEPVLHTVRDAQVEANRLDFLILEVPTDLDADMKTIAKWVIDHIKVGAESIQAIDIPCRAAVIFLQECRDDPEFRREFLKEWMKKLMPTKQQVEYESQFRDDGKDKLELVERTLAAVKEESEEE